MIGAQDSATASLNSESTPSACLHSHHATCAASICIHTSSVSTAEVLHDCVHAMGILTLSCSTHRTPLTIPDLQLASAVIETSPVGGTSSLLSRANFTPYGSYDRLLAYDHPV